MFNKHNENNNNSNDSDKPATQTSATVPSRGRTCLRIDSI